MYPGSFLSRGSIRRGELAAKELGGRVPSLGSCFEIDVHPANAVLMHSRQFMDVGMQRKLRAGAAGQPSLDFWAE